MGLIAYFLLCIVVALLAHLTVKLIHLFAPSAPEVISTLVWTVAILVLVVVLLRALGILSHDIQIPKL